MSLHAITLFIGIKFLLRDYFKSFLLGDYIRQYPKDKFSIIKENKIQIMKAIIYKKVTKEGNDYKGSAQEKIYFLGIPVFCSTKELNER